MTVSIDELVFATSLLASLYAVYSGAVLWTLRDTFSADGLLSRTVYATVLERRPFLSKAGRLLEAPGYVFLARIGTGLAFAAVTLSLERSVWFAAFPAVLLLTDFLIEQRVVAGMSGASDMSTLVNCSLVLLVLFDGRPTLQTIVVAFVAVQGVLSYCVAGLAKLAGSSWRDGSAVERIFATDSWGDDRVRALLSSNDALPLAIAWSVMLFEVAFVLVLVVQPAYAMGLFGVGVLFHFANSALMGINGFQFIFPATYPSILYVNELLRTSGLL
ncbi:HTTM domain-containing protein [Halorubellus litoreus]|uniref:HTTM domain-containing protein n=1 Tax=Halorubellus litoreus TaxID=755308 RepID=A0ABD5VB37_9EURY